MRLTFIKKITNKVKDIYIYLYFILNERKLFKDKYGLSYYIHKNTRPADTLRRGVRTDDTTVLVAINALIEQNLHLKNIHCIDVGAFIGVVTLMMIKALKKSNNFWKVHSFEPFEKTFNRLKENININTIDINNIELNNFGLSDKSGNQKMVTSPYLPGENKLVGKSSNEEEGVYEVEITTLDEYLNHRSIDHVLLCKIDAEGVDDLVMQGMKFYIKTMKVDYFILEYEDELSQQKISKILKKYKYKVYFMVRNKDYIVESLKDYPKNEQSLINILAVSPFADMKPVNKLLES